MVSIKKSFPQPPSTQSAGSFFIVKMRRILQQAEMMMPSRDRKRFPLNISVVRESRSIHRLHHCTQTVVPYHTSSRTGHFLVMLQSISLPELRQNDLTAHLQTFVENVAAHIMIIRTYSISFEPR